MPKSSSCASALLLGALASSAGAEEMDPFAGIPGVVFVYYDVTGRTPDELRKSMNAQRPTDPNSRQAGDALSLWNLRWSWRGTGNGACNLDTVEVTFSATVTLPRIAATNASAATRARWAKYMAALKVHEAAHVRQAYDQVGDVTAALKRATCATVNTVGGAVVAKMAQHDRDYDRATRHGATQGAIFP